MKEKPEAKAASYTLGELARLLEGTVEGDAATVITGAAGLESAGTGDIVFLAGPKFRKALERSRASAAIIPEGESVPTLPVIRSANPQLAFVRAVELLFAPYRPEAGIHPTASVSPTARLGPGVSVGAFTVVGDAAEVGAGVVLFPLVSVYPRVKIGAGSIIHSHVSIREDVRIGERVILHCGAVIGADGFGFLPNPDGTHRKIPQKGIVIIEDDVEIGANSTIDRAALGETIIRRGTKIDDLVIVAHNVEVGENTLLAAQTGIAGSSRVGKNVIMAGQVGIADHLEIGDRVIIAAKSGVTKSVPAGSFVAGVPHLDIRDWRKFWVTAPLLYDLVKDFKKLRARVEELENKLGEKDPAEKE